MNQGYPWLRRRYGIGNLKVSQLRTIQLNMVVETGPSVMPIHLINPATNFAFSGKQKRNRDDRAKSEPMLTGPSESGMEFRDLLSDTAFLGRPRKKRDFQQPFDALRRVTEVFAAHPEDVLQELVDIAMTCCSADSAGISLEEPDPEGQSTFRWVAVAGSFSRYIGGRTPRFYSPCGTCLDSKRPHLYRVTKPYYDFLGVAAEPITDGILIPWETNEIRGTIWAVSHTSEEAFDRLDYELLKSLSGYAAIIIRQQQSNERARQAATAEASAHRANTLAHQINNPLQSLTNTMFLASQEGPDRERYMQVALSELSALSEQVRGLLALRYR